MGNRKRGSGNSGGKKAEEAGHGKSWLERRFGDGRVIRNPINTVMSRRRYGVTSYGDKIKGLSERWEKERICKALLLGRDPWYYHATLAELDFPKYQQAYTSLATQQHGICTPTPGCRGIPSAVVKEEVAAIMSALAAPAKGVLFDIRRCSQRLEPHRVTNGEVESIHLDSGYYVQATRCMQPMDDQSSGASSEGVVEGEEPPADVG